MTILLSQPFPEESAIMFYNMTYDNQHIFFAPKPPYTYYQVIDMNDEEFEKCHDFIQWLFPINSVSKYNPLAPVVTEFFYDNIRKDRAIEATKKMCGFLGFQLYGDLIIYERVREWWVDGNHNALRITRMLQFLKGCGFHYEIDLIKSRLGNCHVIFGPLDACKFWWSV
jgi:hypothetical protein